jgi:hypothetical protein
VALSRFDESTQPLAERATQGRVAPHVGLWAVFRTYRVEHRMGGGVAVLGAGLAVAAHHSALAPFVTRLRQGGADGRGEVVLVDEATGAEVARRFLGTRGGAEAPRSAPRP